MNFILNIIGFYNNKRTCIYIRTQTQRTFLNLNFKHPTEKDDPDPVVADSDPLVASSVCGVLCTELATRGPEFATTGSGSSFSVGCWDQCGVLHGNYGFPM